MKLTDDYVRVERRGAVLVVTMDRPAKLNAYDGEGLNAIGAVWDQLDRDPALRVGVLTGAGERAFCAGADVAAAARGGFDDPPYPELAQGLATKPVIAALTPEAALALGHEQARTLIAMRDTIEGGIAFAERRPPRFEDR